MATTLDELGTLRASMIHATEQQMVQLALAIARRILRREVSLDDDLVIAISAPLWRQMTINTMIPAASEESYSQGAQRFSFGKLEAGDSFRFKIDGQINPSLFAGTRGEIAVLDGDRRIVGTPVTMKVLP